MTQSSSATSGSVEDFFVGIDTVPALLAKRAALSPDKPAHYTENVGGSWGLTTWSELFVAVEHVAAGLADLGLAQSERIAILAGTSQDWEICQFAALQLGAIV